ncbi:MAG: NAD(P)/FAD-dependent oxidoreductase [Christensenellales bacterium]
MKFDVVIIGAGAGGMSAAIYAKRAGKSVLVLEKMFAGGQINTIDRIANFPGFENVSGFDLAENIRKQVQNLGIEIKNEEVVSCSLLGEEKIVRTHKNEYVAKSIVIATGARSKPLDVQNEKQYLGRGISYCATCDGKFFEGQTVAVVGTYETAKTDVSYLENLASKIYFVTTSENKNFSSEKIEEITSSKIIRLFGKDNLEGIVIKNQKNGQEREIATNALFVELGKSPDLSMFEGNLKLDSKGFVEVDQRMQTNIPGVFAVGDVRSGSLKQIVTACSDGAIAGTFA